METDAAAPVRLAIDEGLAIVTLARPQAGNAIDLPLAEAFAAVAARVAGDPAVRAVLLQSEGRNFCVGGDLKAIAGDPDPAAFLDGLVRRVHDGVTALAAGPAPVVVAVQGAAAGAGLSLVAGGDIVIAGRASSYSLAYSGVGLVADGGATWLLPRLIGLRAAQSLAYEGRRLGAEEAERLGLVTRLVDDEAVAAEAQAAARAIAAGPTQAYARIKRLLAATFAATLPEQLGAEHGAITEAMATEDAKGAIAAFLERRPPSFQGR